MHRQLILLTEEERIVNAGMDEHLQTMTTLLHTNSLSNLPRITQEAEQLMLKGKRQALIRQQENDIKMTLQRISQAATIV